MKLLKPCGSRQSLGDKGNVEKHGRNQVGPVERAGGEEFHKTKTNQRLKRRNNPCQQEEKKPRPESVFSVISFFLCRVLNDLQRVRDDNDKNRNDLKKQDGFQHTFPFLSQPVII